MSTTCIFCKILKKEIPATLVYEDEHVIAFKDLHPQAPTHVLVIPRQHIPTLNDVTPEQGTLVGAMFQAAQKIAVQFGVHQTGYRTVFNVNSGAGQTVYHLHLHVLGGRMLSWPPG